MPDLIAVLEQVPVLSWAAFAAVAFAGLLMGVAPSSLPLISVVTGFVAGRHDTAQVRPWASGLAPSAGFVLGMATVDAAIGAVSGLIGFAVLRALATQLALVNLLLAVILIIIGLALLRLVRVPWPTLRRPRTQKAHSFGTGFALGIPFGLATCPACTPMVLPILGAAAASGTAWAGAALLFTFGLTRGVPVLVAGTVTGSVKHVRRLAPVIPAVERAGAFVVLAASIYFLYRAAVYAGLLMPAELPG